MRLDHWRTDPEVWDQFERYLAGTLPLAEHEDVCAYLLANPAVERSFLILRDQASLIPTDTLRQIDPHQRWTQLAHSLHIRPSSETARRKRGTSQRPVWIGSVIAGAIVAGALGIGWPLRTPPMTKSTMRTYVTRTGERSVVQLANGTRITLAPQTTLRISDGTSGPSAEGIIADLKGEAMFDVIANHQVPFVVRTGRVSTRVLGTVFDVQRYANDHDTRVAVMTGKVVVATPGVRTAVTLTAGTVGRVTDSTVTSAASSDLQQYTDWARGRLVFRATPVRDALVAFGRWYGYEFRLTDSTLAKTLVTASFDYRDGRDALHALTTVLGVRATADGSVIVLSPLRRQLRAPERRDVREQFISSRAVGR